MAAETKSPFYIVQDFLSPMMCEDVVDALEFTVPDMDKDGCAVATAKTCDYAEQIVYERFLQVLPDIEKYYGIDYKGMEPIQFEWFPAGTTKEAHAENANFLRGKWLRTRARDLTAVLFLSDYQDEDEFEQEFECYGGKLEFPQHKFGFTCKRGTLVVFPSDPHFINITTPVYLGDLFQVRIQVAAQNTYIYQPAEFKGDFTVWFKDLM